VSSQSGIDIDALVAICLHGPVADYARIMQRPDLRLLALRSPGSGQTQPVPVSDRSSVLGVPMVCVVVERHGQAQIIRFCVNVTPRVKPDP
jgi:hypothetical protein